MSPLIATTLIHALLSAASAAPLSNDELRQALQAHLPPDVRIDSILPTPIAGLREVHASGRTLFVTPDGEHFVIGDLYQTAGMVNLSEQGRQRNSAKLLAMPGVARQAIDFIPPGAKHVVTVFTDPDCSFCRRLHADQAAYAALGIGFRYLFYPRAGVPSETADRSIAIWCADDRQRAYTDAMNGEPVQVAMCDNPVADTYRLGQAVGVVGTPAIYAPDGRHIGGYLPPQAMRDALDASKGAQ